MADDLARLNLESKLADELQNHLDGLEDQDLEDVIDLLIHVAQSSKDFAEFQKQTEAFALTTTLVKIIYDAVAQFTELQTKASQVKAEKPGEKSNGRRREFSPTKDSNSSPLSRDTRGVNRDRALPPSRGYREDDLYVSQSRTHGALTGVPLVSETATDRQLALRQENGKKRKLNDYERWEAQQLRSSGVLRQNEMSTEELDDLAADATPKTEEEVEIEINEREPAFLKNQTSRSGQQLESIKVIANPDGSLARAAATAGILAKERREMRDQAERTMLESLPRDIQQPWEDPNPDPGERTIAAALRGAGYTGYEVPQWKRQHVGKSVGFGQRTDLSIVEQRRSLPISKLRDPLIKAIRENQVLIVIGETGSGKTTQMTQYIYEAGLHGDKIIGCTQPRRVAAISIAKRVAEEFGCPLGQEVGYSIRFEDCTSTDTVIKYMTDGILLRERIVDPLLSRYSLIMLDEAHERTISTDVLFGLLKALLQKRKDFKLIVTSATLEAEKFSEFFFSAKIFTIPGRTFPVEIYYAKQQESDYVEAALMTVLQIHLTQPPGDILVFLTGQEEIDSACQVLHDRMEALKSHDPPPLIILPVYSSLPSEVQTMIFDPAPPGCRKCVVATNIAEASLTIDGISFVVDPGVAKVKVYSPKTGIESLTVVPISQANARQRSGRAGRTQPGKCYRLYTEEAYKTEMLPTAIPEIQRTNLANTVLQLKAMGVNDLMTFDFMDPPPKQTLINSLEVLYELGALDDEGFMTRLGRRMAEFPMEPQLGKMLLVAVDFGCSDEIITITAMLQVENVFYRPRDRQAHADQKKNKFHRAEGDHITYLEVYKAWQRNNFSNPWCYENFVQARSLRRAQEVRKQLIGILDRYQYPVNSVGKDTIKIRKSICAGYFRHAARKDPHEGYKTLVDSQQVYLHPSSCLYQSHPEFIIYHELVLTTKEYLRDCCTIDPNWLVDFAPNLYKRADEKRLSTRKRKEKIEPLFNRYEEPNAWRLSRRRI
eukprot:Blabericola_migrator_1__1774@NODE_147_length_12949_cov_102_817264_g128_i0_p2_GENE_NODE_147_length_12949_cov_102_817264_g128_i0NODE_147_length_12949_cov_102_817264_g128_i0_p2_ORF_typecomplete_len998_score194_77HA2/PF04408_23/4_8e03HA2/PF04408_23/1_5e33Flavi_DEAD/PF07652_14/2_8e27OB_NTP_bind/PF07717_16/5_2e27DEAD/PF00270_29/9e14AAA_22/PF13401_6/4_1e12Helicase_C/PF00271_31/6_7e11AAA_19/PF13245_6/2_6e03AAA_19/PF13245_6/4_9e09ResIII/PF04851_15/1_1e05SRP54/PF00448_22/6_9e02SRP54/PF00448_22/0_0022Herpe